MFICRLGGRGIALRTFPLPRFAMAKRKASALATVATDSVSPPLPPPKRPARRKANLTSTNPDANADVLDGPEALRASPDAEGKGERFAIENVDDVDKAQIKEEENGLRGVDGNSDSSLSDAPEIESPIQAKPKANGKAKNKSLKTEKAPKAESATPPPKKEPQNLDPEADGEEEADEAEIQAASQRPPAVNSDYLPLPWKGRLGYVGYPVFKPFPSLCLRSIGLSQYVFTLLQSSRLCITNMQNSFYSREPSPTQRPQSACPSNQEPT